MNDNPSDTARILRKAADVIETRGWNQGGYMPSFSGVDPRTCPVCVLAAINVAAGREPYEDFTSGDSLLAALVLADFLGLGLGNDVESHEEGGIENVVGNDWNDCTATSAEQVTKALRECAAELTEAAK